MSDSFRRPGTARLAGQRFDADARSGIGMTSERTRRRLLQQLQEQGIVNAAVLDTLFRIPRHLFLDEALQHRAYEDSALPLGHGQTMSKPYVVARMTELVLEAVPDARRVLEIGTGCGYQAAVLADRFEHVFSIERLVQLHRRARDTLRRLGTRNIQLRLGDGYLGWPDEAPFDAILLAAAPAEIPQALLDQMADGAVLVAPVGMNEDQQLVRVRRHGDELRREVIESARFVPMVHGR